MAYAKTSNEPGLRGLPTLNLPKKSHQSATAGKCRPGICQDLSLYCCKKKEHMGVQTVFQ